MMKPLIILTALALAAPVAAQQTFAAPEGCTGRSDRSEKSCVMTNVWRARPTTPVISGLR